MTLLRRTAIAGILALVAWGSASCGGKADDGGSSPASTTDGDYSKTAVKGKFGGKDWTYGSGRALPTGAGTGDSQLYTAELVSDVVDDPCAKFNFQAADQKKVSLVTTMAIAEQALDKTHTLTFIDDAQDPGSVTTVTDGESKIVEKSKAQVRGRLKVAKDTDNSLNGTFTISLCCEADDGLSYQACK